MHFAHDDWRGKVTVPQRSHSEQDAHVFRKHVPRAQAAGGVEHGPAVGQVVVAHVAELANALAAWLRPEVGHHALALRPALVVHAVGKLA